MDARTAKKALYRAKLKEATQKRDNRIDSPLVRYNEHDQPVCRVCNVILKSESLWAAHQASRKHHEVTLHIIYDFDLTHVMDYPIFICSIAGIYNKDCPSTKVLHYIKEVKLDPTVNEFKAIENVKALAASKTKTNDAKSEPPAEVVHKSWPSSTLPPDFFDKNDTKRQKTGLGTGNKIESGAPKAIKSVDSTSSTAIYEKSIGFSLIHPVESFHSRKLVDKSSNGHGACPEIKIVRGALPEGFFDIKDSSITNETPSSKVEGSKDPHTDRKVGNSDVKQVKGSLPEGFFDNKDADLRARGIEPVKIDIKDEYKEFEKLIQEDLHEVDERLEEEEIDAAEVIEEEETLEQRGWRERVERLKLQRMELKGSRLDRLKAACDEKDSSEEDTSSDEDDNVENLAVDWRAKHL
ncbi:hypothetical protein GIB67_012564 [Kingdonia uniflora]|uniref:C2H2-type domain-containing protein n=1 Tax=Kingdonia uniflora TaxID=39325 RepID=A0A7J7NET1_9MAGN|nr:hypothetical protein GIB67_012564 [Kingdonia uniflora]